MSKSASNIINDLPTMFNGEDAAGSLDAVFQFNVTDKNEEHFLRVNGNECSVLETPPEQSDLSISASNDDMVELLEGSLDGMTGLLEKRVAVDGKLILAQRFASLFNLTQI